MSRIRVYELAKEVGISGKELADRLIGMGYDIKGHSSTVEDHIAAEIRGKILKTGPLQKEGIVPPVEEPQTTSTQSTTVNGDTVVEKRIEAKSGTTVIRRRHKKISPVEEKGEPQTTAMEEKPPIMEASPEPTGGMPTCDTRESQPPAMDQELTSAAEHIPETDEKAAGKETLEKEPINKTEQIASKEKKKSFLPKEEPTLRKQFAKVIKRAAITLPQEQPAPQKASQPSRPAGVPAAALSNKPKIKGKRVVQMAPTPDVNRDGRRRRAVKGDKRTRRKVEFDKSSEDRTMRSMRKKERTRKRTKQEESAASTIETKAIKKRIKVLETITVGDLAHRMGLKANEIIAKLMGLGVMATVNQALDIDTATLIATDFGYEIEQTVTDEQHMVQLNVEAEGGEEKPRPPVVTVMGHVDHGKTSILDAIRKTDVAAGEAGGITQHIGAYHVRAPEGDVVFLDTPGHAAFTEMRSRGAKVTDIVVLVVAADDGVMDQTKEAINHARAAGVPIVVAVNKIDKPDAEPDRVKRELAELDLAPEEWGGQTIYCETSAKQGLGISELLEAIQLQAEILELSANPNRHAWGRVIEAQLHKGRGPVATVLVQDGTLRSGDFFVIGEYSGKVRALFNDRGNPISQAGPSMPVEIQGLSGVPNAGDEFIVVPDEKMARSVSATRQMKSRESDLAAKSKISLENLFARMGQEAIKELRLVLRADVQGTLEAFRQSAQDLSTDEVTVNIIHQGTGTITESDILLASASDAIVIGFNVRPSAKLKEMAEKEQVDLRFYDVIYHALEDIRGAMTGLLSPVFEEEVIGSAEVRDTFKVPKAGTVAGCFVTSGKIVRSSQIRVMREGVIVYTGKIASLKRFKDDAREVLSGYECGISVENFNDIKVGDALECFIIKERAAEL